jgi:hypothetical protein
VYKLRNDSIIEMFEQLKIHVPSETTLRGKVDKIYFDQIKNIKGFLKIYQSGLCLMKPSFLAENLSI